MAGESGEGTPKPQPRYEELFAKFEELSGQLEGVGGLSRGLYDPMEALNRTDATDLTGREKEVVKEVLLENRLSHFLVLSGMLKSVVESTSAKKEFYPLQHIEEGVARSLSQTELRLFSVKEGMNEAILGNLMEDQIRELSGTRIFYWSLPYLAMYWNGLGSLTLISERNQQLPMADLSRFFHGTEAKWIKDKTAQLPADAKEFLPLVEGGETLPGKFARYTSDSFFWNQVRSEINRFNPLLGERELNMTKTMQRFMVDLCTSRSKVTETGEVKTPPKPIKIYLDSDGRQVAQDRDGVPLGEFQESFSVETLDYFNNNGSENDRRWVIATTAALCIHNAKAILDELPYDIDLISSPENSPESSRYNELFAKVKATAEEIVDNFDVFKKSLLEQKLATTGFDLAYAVAFGSFWVSDWGWSYRWKMIDVSRDADGNITSCKYEPEDKVGSQGDPTASGDAFTARYPLFHEWVYSAIKNRVSASNAGVLMPLDGELAHKAINALLSETAAVNERGAMIERLKKGEQPHITRFFGVIGAFEGEIGKLDSWKKGQDLRNKVGKVANENFVHAVEELVIFAPTPFKDSSGDNLYYPVIMPQFPTSLFDMLSVGKEYTAGDLLRKTWIEEGGLRREARPENGGRRLTLIDVDWKEYKAYAEDARAVNNNFTSQVYNPIYGAADPKKVDAIAGNPVVGMTSLIKAIDILSRAYIKKLKGGGKIERPSFEIICGSDIVFQHMVLGRFGALGRGSVQRYLRFLEEITPPEKAKGKSDNLYLTLRNIEDFLSKKQEYPHYSDSFYLSFLAKSEAMKPIVEASERMAEATTERMEKTKTTGAEDFRDNNPKEF